MFLDLSNFENFEKITSKITSKFNITSKHNLNITSKKQLLKNFKHKKSYCDNISEKNNKHENDEI